MTRLLVSVRDASEAADAVVGGADLIDIKEPNAGSLGAASSDAVRQIVAEVDGRLPISVALGELTDARSSDLSYLGGVDYAKVGLAGASLQDGWVAEWASLIGRFPHGVKPVAVVYADYKTANAPSPDDVLHHARRFGCAAILIDTFDKAKGRLTDQWSLAELRRLVEQVKIAEMLMVVAGSLREEDLPAFRSIAPDYVAVRSAVCETARTARLSRTLVERMSHVLKGQSVTVSSLSN